MRDSCSQLSNRLNLSLSIQLLFTNWQSEIGNYSTVRPICRAVPSIVLIADSKLVVFKSCNLVFAISSTLAREIVPTFSRFGLPDPFGIAAAFFKKSAAGGGFGSKLDRKSVG